MKLHHTCVRILVASFAILAFTSLNAHAARYGSTDRPGLDYRSFELSAPNPDLCENACKREGQCRAWTFSWPGAKGPKAMCALKTGVPPKRSDTCCISGTISTGRVTTQTDKQPGPGENTSKKAETPAKKNEKTAEKKTPVTPTKPENQEAKTARVETAPVPAPQNANQNDDRSVVVPRTKPDDLVPKGDDDAPDIASPAPETRNAAPEDGEPARPAISAAKAAACRDYANRAVAQNAENRQLGCRLRGSRWGYGYQAYYNYCAKSPEYAYQSARRGRDADLAQCQQRLARRNQNRIEPDVGRNEDVGRVRSGRVRSFCRNFARQSVRQAYAARQLACGFGGRRWSDSRLTQARLCENIGPRAAARLLNTRARQLDNCRRDDGYDVARAGFGHCEEYASVAVRQARLARRLGCGFGGPRWATRMRPHLRWCRKVAPGRARSEFRARERYLARCE